MPFSKKKSVPQAKKRTSVKKRMQQIRVRVKSQKKLSGSRLSSQTRKRKVDVVGGATTGSSYDDLYSLSSADLIYNV